MLLTNKQLTTLLLSFFILLSFVTLGQVQANKDTVQSIKGDIIVKTRKDTPPYYLVRQLPSYTGIRVARVLSSHSDIWLLQFNEEKISKQEMMQLLRNNKDIIYAQPNRVVHLRKAPNDPKYGSQWQFSKIQAEAAWAITTGGQTKGGTDIVVALMESSDLMGHEDLKGNQWVNTNEIPNNGIDDDNNGYTDDYNGWNVSSNDDNIGAGNHGTSCAGMIGAVGDNGIGVTGINWNVKIMCIAGHDSPFTEANIVEAYNYALQARKLWNQTNGNKGAFVVVTSASWGIDGGDPTNYPIWCSFYDDLGKVGILNVGATTNQSKNVDVYGDVPTACSSNYMIGVTATNSSDIIDFAGYGKNTIEVAAPGSAIYTTAQSDSYTTISGTSFACPLTAGLIGLMYSVPCNNLEALAIADPQGTADMVKQALMNGVDQTSYLQSKVISGGRINAKKSIDTLMSIICTSCMFPFQIKTDSIKENSATVSFQGNGSAYIVYLRKKGESTWKDYHTNNTQYTFTQLKNCTEYEYYITTDCGSIESIPSSTYTFKTKNCGNCIDLPYCATKGKSPSVTLTIHSPSNIAGAYNYVPTTFFGGDVKNGYAYAELILADDGSANPEEGCNALLNASSMNGNIAVIRRGNCNFTLKVKNAQDAGAIAAIIVNNVSSAPIEMAGTDNSITIPAVMISQSDGATIINAIQNKEHPKALLGLQKEWIKSFKIDGNLSNTGNNNGYLLSSSSIALQQGESYAFELTPGFDGNPLQEYTRVWLDLDQDGIFQNTEVIYDQGTPGFGTLNAQLTIPSNALLGSTRMRVQIAYQGYGAAPLPSSCGTYVSGETEDYCVTIHKSAQLAKENIKSFIKIYPNPAMKTVSVNNLEEEEVEIRIFNLSGQLFKTFSIASGTKNIQVQDWAAGIYILHIYSKEGKELSTKKLSIIH